MIFYCFRPAKLDVREPKVAWVPVSRALKQTIFPVEICEPCRRRCSLVVRVMVRVVRCIIALHNVWCETEQFK